MIMILAKLLCLVGLHGETFPQYNYVKQTHIQVCIDCGKVVAK